MDSTAIKSTILSLALEVKLLVKFQLSSKLVDGSWYFQLKAETKAMF